MSPWVQGVIDKAFWSVVIGMAGRWLMWPLKDFRKKVEEAFGKIDGLEKELVLQRTNHLTHIEENGTKQVELLDEMVSELKAMHLTQVEMSGYLKAKD